jgi:hypothetical protein
LTRNPIRNAPACAGETSPASSAALASRASSKVRSRDPRGPVATALIIARNPA